MSALPPGDQPGRDLDAEALARVLDGLEMAADADDAERTAHARAEDDVAALSRAFALMGAALAEPAATPAADDKGTVVLPFAVRLRQKAPVLAAAASLVAIIGLGAVLVGNDGSEGLFDTSDGDSSPVAQAPAADVPTAAVPEAAAPEAVEDSAADAAAATSGAAAAGEGATESKAAKAAKSESAATAKTSPGETEAGSGTLSNAPQPKKNSAKVTALDAAVACNRGIFVGTVVTVLSAGSGYRLTVAISDWIAPSSGQAVRTFQVGEDYALTDGGRRDLTVGREFLFVVPQSPSKAVYAFVGSAYSEARERVATARAGTKDRDC